MGSLPAATASPRRPVLGWAAAAMSPDGAMMRVVPVAGALALVAVGSVLTLRALSAPMLSLF